MIDWDSSLGGFRYIQMTGHTLNNCRGQGEKSVLDFVVTIIHKDYTFRIQRGGPRSAGSMEAKAAGGGAGP